jgi:hypothetical protein
MMAERGVHVTTLLPPQQYTSQQIDLAVAIAHELERGKFVLCIPPAR